MKKWLLWFLLMPGAAMAQTDALNGLCSQGGVSATVQGLNSTNKLDGIVPSCQVTVYFTGTTNKVTALFKDSIGTPLSNPFTAAAQGSAAPGQWLFWAATGQGYDVVMSGGIPPLTFTQPVTLTDLKVGGSSGGPTLTIIPGVNITCTPFVGTNCPGPTVTINSTVPPPNLVLQHNGVPLSSQNLLNFNDTTPAAPTGFTNITYLPDGTGRLSAYVPSFGGSIQMQVVPPVGGQHVVPVSRKYDGDSNGASKLSLAITGSLLAWYLRIRGVRRRHRLIQDGFVLPSHINPR